MYIAELECRLRAIMENEGGSCSFDHDLIVPEYVNRMWAPIYMEINDDAKIPLV